ncbi:hypothetical protein [Actinokineospora xionganensis]|uniref:Uncharacterized protein n=1 Tax=Actinokineospora xionganensis TaxID=2684470 RepID=A0ABR7L0J6_9PSEU|nr:hypothetical protein [Actinokineospora xionganensis]MBC6446222.1 hypothetical protein [Actinokineospora xionganensis]
MDATLVVLDPADTAAHGDLPATWRPFAQTRRVLWCATARDGLRNAVTRALAEADGPVDLLAAGIAADPALEVAAESPDRVNRVLLVDPGADADVAPGGPAEEASDEWMRSRAGRRQALAAAGVDVSLVAYSEGGARDRVPPPIPLGHPDVLDAVLEALRSTTTDVDDYADPDDFAEAIGVDPTADEVEDYRSRTE